MTTTTIQQTDPLAAGSYYEHVSHLVFRYGEADGKCSLCNREGHQVAACGYEVRTSRHRGGAGEAHNGIEVCPECLEKHGAEAGRIAIIRTRDRHVPPPRDDFTPKQREDWEEEADCWIPMAAFVEVRPCIMPPILSAEWFPHSKC